MPRISVEETLRAYTEQEDMHCLEGRRGLKAICQIAGALGYKDPQYYGQLSSKATLGDLVCMLEDNSGMIEAMVEWIGTQYNPEWITALESQLQEEESVTTMVDYGPVE